MRSIADGWAAGRATGRRLWLHRAPATRAAPDGDRQERYPIFVRVADDTIRGGLTLPRPFGASVRERHSSFPRWKGSEGSSLNHGGSRGVGNAARLIAGRGSRPSHPKPHLPHTDILEGGQRRRA